MLRVLLLLGCGSGLELWIDVLGASIPTVEFRVSGRRGRRHLFQKRFRPMTVFSVSRSGALFRYHGMLRMVSRVRRLVVIQYWRLLFPDSARNGARLRAVAQGIGRRRRLRPVE